MQAVYIQSFAHFLSFFHTLFLTRSCYRSNLKNGNVSENVTKRSLNETVQLSHKKSRSFIFIFISRGSKEDETSNSNFPNYFLPLGFYSINSIYINFFLEKNRNDTNSIHISIDILSMETVHIERSLVYVFIPFSSISFTGYDRASRKFIHSLFISLRLSSFIRSHMSSLEKIIKKNFFLFFHASRKFHDKLDIFF